MPALKMRTPVGVMPIRDELIDQMSSMTDRQIAEKALDSGPFIDPEFYAELCNRGLSGPGMHRHDTYRLIHIRESRALK